MARAWLIAGDFIPTEPMFECPVCDAEIHKDNADRCPDCGWRFCAWCHQTVPDGPGFACCDNNHCRYYGKMICSECLCTDRVGVMQFVPGAMFGMLIVLYAAMQIQVFNAIVGLVFVAVVALCAGVGRLLLGTAARCPRCRAGVLWQQND